GLVGLDLVGADRQERGDQGDGQRGNRLLLQHQPGGRADGGQQDQHHRDAGQGTDRVLFHGGLRKTQWRVSRKAVPARKPQADSATSSGTIRPAWRGWRRSIRRTMCSIRRLRWIWRNIDINLISNSQASFL